MLPSPGTFHSLIGMAMAEARQVSDTKRDTVLRWKTAVEANLPTEVLT